MAMYSHPVTVRFPETDPAGITFFANLIVFCHHAFEAWTASIGFPLSRMLDEGWGMPFVASNQVYERPSFLGDILRIEVELERLGGRSLTLRFVIHNETRGHRVGRFETTQVAADMEKLRPMEIPGAFRAAIEASAGATPEAASA